MRLHEIVLSSYIEQKIINENQDLPTRAKYKADVGGIQLDVSIDGASVDIRAMAMGRQLGYVVFGRDGQTLIPDDLAIDETFRGQGIAKIMYDHAKDIGFTIRRSKEQTDAGRKFWDKYQPYQDVWEDEIINESEFTFDQPRRQLNIPELIKRGAIFVTHPHGPDGWETDSPDWAFSLITLQNVLQKSPDWVVDYKKYISADKKLTQDFINKISDQKYQQILWSIKKLGIPDNIAFLDQQGVTEAPLPPDWDETKYKLGTTFKDRIEYAMQKAEKIGAGSSRVAFVFEYEGRPTVLKIAKNKKGLAQNEAEVDILDDYYTQSLGIVIPIIDYDKQNPQPAWIHTEFAEKATEKKLCDIMKCPGLLDAKQSTGALYNLVFLASAITGKDPHVGRPQEILARFKQKGMSDQELETLQDYANRIADLMANFDLNAGDLRSSSNWGIYKGEPVIIDLGLTETVWSNEYVK